MPWAAMGTGFLFVDQKFSAIALDVAAAAMQKRRSGFHTGVIAQGAIGVVLVTSSLWLFTEATYFKASPLFAISLVLLLARPGVRGKVGRFVGGVSYPFYLNYWIALIGVWSLHKRLGGDGYVWAVFGMMLAFAIGSGAC